MVEDFLVIIYILAFLKKKKKKKNEKKKKGQLNRYTACNNLFLDMNQKTIQSNTSNFVVNN